MILRRLRRWSRTVEWAFVLFWGTIAMLYALGLIWYINT